MDEHQVEITISSASEELAKSLVLSLNESGVSFDHQEFNLERHTALGDSELAHVFVIGLASAAGIVKYLAPVMIEWIRTVDKAGFEIKITHNSISFEYAAQKGPVPTGLEQQVPTENDGLPK